jgi:protein SCO1/2
MNSLPPRGFASRSTLLVLCAALAAALGMYSAQRYFTPKSAPKRAVVEMQAVRLFDAPREIGEFKLDGANGQGLTRQALAGHWTLVFLGFTHCPDVCPTTLAELAKAQKLWREMPEAIRPRLLFVSVDPERDTPKIVADYARYFDPDTLAATAAAQPLADFASAMGLVYMKVPMPDGDYSMDHSATLVLLDPQGRQAGLVRPPFDANAIASDLRKLAEASR